jgi:hypothetical protein
MSTPSTDPLRRYADVKQAFDAARAEVFEMRSRLLLHESRFRAEHVGSIVPGDVAVPSVGVATGPPISIAPEEWPTWEQFRGALDAYYKAQEAYDRVLSELSSDDRTTIRLN